MKIALLALLLFGAVLVVIFFGLQALGGNTFYPHVGPDLPN